MRMPYLHRSQSGDTSRSPDGVTLLEMLLVIVIMLMITAAALPVLVPALQGREVREAARMVDVFINGARNRALQTGQSVGVMFDQTLPNGGSTVVRYVEVPPAYLGDFSGSEIWCNFQGNYSGALAINPISSTCFSLGDIGWYPLVRPGDLIEFGGHATRYRLFGGEPYLDIDANGVFTPTVDWFTDVNQDGQYSPPPPGIIDNDGYFSQLSPSLPLPYFGMTPPPVTFCGLTYTYADPAVAIQHMSVTGGNKFPAPTGPASFRIFRQPIPLASGALELPEGTAIDLGTTISIQQNTTLSSSNALAIPGSGLDDLDNASFRPYPIFNTAGAVPSAYTQCVIVTFAPDGLVDMVYSWDAPTFTFTPGALVGWMGRKVTGPIYFLVGHTELLGGDPALLPDFLAGTAPRKPVFNVQDPTALWITVNPRTGAIRSTQSGFVNLSQAPAGTTQQQLQQYVTAQAYQSREIARDAVTQGAR